MSSTHLSRPGYLQRLLSWFQISHMSAGLIAVLVGYTSSAAIVFQAAQAAGANTAELGRFRIVKEQSSSAGVRRIKAVLE